MSNAEHLAVIKRGAAAWNRWREENPSARPDLTGADLSGLDLGGADFSLVKLGSANLSGADLEGANLWHADLAGVNCSGANLRGAKLSGMKLAGTNFNGANLSWADLSGVDLSGADLAGANLRRAVLADANLKGTQLGKADLSEANLIAADLDGAELTGVRTSRWYIKQVRCSHVFRDGKRIDYADRNDFEKAWAHQCETVEFVLELPSSVVSYLTGEAIRGLLARKYAGATFTLRSHEGLSATTTRLEIDISGAGRHVIREIELLRQGLVPIINRTYERAVREGREKKKAASADEAFSLPDQLHAKALADALHTHLSKFPQSLQEIIRAIQPFF